MWWVLPSLDRGSKRGLDGGRGRVRRRRLQALVALAAAALVMLGAAGAAQASRHRLGGRHRHQPRRQRARRKSKSRSSTRKEPRSAHTTTASNGDIHGPWPLSAGEYTVVFSDKTENYLPKQLRGTVEEGNITKENAVLIKGWLDHSGW